MTWISNDHLYHIDFFLRNAMMAPLFTSENTIAPTKPTQSMLLQLSRWVGTVSYIEVDVDLMPQEIKLIFFRPIWPSKSNIFMKWQLILWKWWHLFSLRSALVEVSLKFHLHLMSCHISMSWKQVMKLSTETSLMKPLVLQTIQFLELCEKKTIRWRYL